MDREIEHIKQFLSGKFTHCPEKYMGNLVEKYENLVVITEQYEEMLGEKGVI